MKKIGVITTSRADYGLYLPILRKFQKSRECELQLFVTGGHLSKRQGYSVDMIKKDGFSVTAKVRIPEGDRPVDIAHAMGRAECLERFSDQWA